MHSRVYVLFMYINVGPDSLHQGTGVAEYSVCFLGRQQWEAFSAMLWKLQPCYINQLQCKIMSILLSQKLGQETNDLPEEVLYHNLQKIPGSMKEYSEEHWEKLSHYLKQSHYCSSLPLHVIQGHLFIFRDLHHFQLHRNYTTGEREISPSTPLEFLWLD